MSATAGIHVWLIVLKAHQALQKVAQQSIDSAEFCFSDFMILEALLHKGPMLINALGETLQLTSGSLTTAVDRLAARGLLERHAHQTDRRARVIHLTDAGRDVIVPLFQAHAQQMETVFAVLSEAERETLIRLMKTLGFEAQRRLAAD